ncbi:MAG: hypothetical protein KatS3mg103_0190 [Phycisphaerales bacterium]|nr:MAG: hypothetical protein KatS3mg103_0190 [Phycisphaerales bacterium]
MPQPVPSRIPTLPETAASGPASAPVRARNEPWHEGTVRAQAQAEAFGVLLVAMQAGQAGLVVGQGRDDSAAEWNAQQARQAHQDAGGGRQARRSEAQIGDDRAQETRRGEGMTHAGPRAGQSLESPAEQARRALAERAEPAPKAGGHEAPRGPSAAAQAPQPPASAGDRSTGVSQTGQASWHTHAGWSAASAGGPAQGASAAARPGGVAGPSGPAPAAAAGVSGPADANTRATPGGPRAGQARPTPRPDVLRFERAFRSQLDRGLAQALRSGNGTVTLRLKPESLGVLRVHVQVEDGTVRATFEAQSEPVRRLLEGSQQALRQQLEARGLAVHRIEVRLMDDAGVAGTRLADEGSARSGQDDPGQGAAGQDGPSSQDGSGGGQDPGSPGGRSDAWVPWPAGLGSCRRRFRGGPGRLAARSAARRRAIRRRGGALAFSGRPTPGRHRLIAAGDHPAADHPRKARHERDRLGRRGGAGYRPDDRPDQPHGRAGFPGVPGHHPGRAAIPGPPWRPTTPTRWCSSFPACVRSRAT